MLQYSERRRQNARVAPHLAGGELELTGKGPGEVGAIEANLVDVLPGHYV